MKAFGFGTPAIGWAAVMLAGPNPFLAAQGLPPYASLNPVVEMRSGLTTLPWLGPERCWHVLVTSDYGSLIEYAAGEQDGFILDAEILAIRVLAARAIGGQGFVLAETSWNGSYDGFLDGFLEWYHNLTGLRVAARDLRPKNEFAYQLRLQERQFEYRKTSGFLGDIRVGAGLRHHRDWQSVVSVTLPTGSSPAGYRKGAASANLTTMYHKDFGRERRFTYEGTLGAGYTPRQGDLREWQRTTFFLMAQGLRARLIGPWHGYAHLVYGSPYYRGTGIPDLDRKELTLDAGALFRFGRGPTWLLGMTQDLAPRGPAIDVAFRLGVYW